MSDSTILTMTGKILMTDVYLIPDSLRRLRGAGGLARCRVTGRGATRLRVLPPPRSLTLARPYTMPAIVVQAANERLRAVGATRLRVLPPPRSLTLARPYTHDAGRAKIGRHTDIPTYLHTCKVQGAFLMFFNYSSCAAGRKRNSCRLRANNA